MASKCVACGTGSDSDPITGGSIGNPETVDVQAQIQLCTICGPIVLPYFETLNGNIGHTLLLYNALGAALDQFLKDVDLDDDDEQELPPLPSFRLGKDTSIN